MEKNDIVRITTQCVPKGIVPDKYAKLLYKYSKEYTGKWYAVLVKFDNSMLNAITVDTHIIFLLEPELES